MREWRKVKLGDVSSTIQTGPFGSQLHQSDYSGSGTPVVMPKDIISGTITTDSIARVGEDHVKRLVRHKISEGDIIYARRGDVGKCAYTKKGQNGWLCGTGCLRVTVDKEIANSKFIFFQLQKRETIGWVEKHAVGATMLNLNTSILGDIPVEVPPLDIQNKIVDILSRYDSLIENYQTQIKLLEEAAQRLYKEWFIDLRFPGHETAAIIDGIPEGWEKKKLVDVFTYIRGRSYSSKELVEEGGILMVNLKNIQAFGGYKRNAEKRYIGQYNDNQTLHKGDLVMGVTDMTKERRLVGHTALIPNLYEQATYSMDLIKIISKSIQNVFLHGMFRFGGISNQISSLANGVNVLHLKPESMMNIEVAIPKRELISDYVTFAGKGLEEILSLQSQIMRLTEARDRLLPKLMSGEIEP